MPLQVPCSLRAAFQDQVRSFGRVRARIWGVALRGTALIWLMAHGARLPSSAFPVALWKPMQEESVLQYRLCSVYVAK